MPKGRSSQSSIPRRDFLKKSVATAGVIGASGTGGCEDSGGAAGGRAAQDRAAGLFAQGTGGHRYNSVYTGEHLDRVAFPMGGMGGGMVCLEGAGGFSHVSLRNQPEVFNDPFMFAAVCVKDQPNTARVLEGPLAKWKLFGLPGSGNGLGGKTYGLPRFGSATFLARFPFAKIELTDDKVPLGVEITGWSPFIPGDADASSLPVAGLEYRFRNPTNRPIEAVFSFNAKNFLASDNKFARGTKAAQGGFTVYQEGSDQEPWAASAFCAAVTDPGVKVNLAWFRGGWFDPYTICWKDIQEGACYDRPAPKEGDPASGASLFVPFTVAAGKDRTIVLEFSWYSGRSNLRIGKNTPEEEKSAAKLTYSPWYSGRFANVEAVARYWRESYDSLRQRSAQFSECFYDSTLPPEVIEAIAANLTILKSPTVLRQTDGRLWAWEGCGDNKGCCHGSCTHVWNYAQALPHLFPAIERMLRETEFNVTQADTGHQTFRVSLPIRQPEHDFHAASDGQLGGIMKVYREWRVGGDTDWLRKLWPKVKSSLDYCIATWDPGHKGILEEPHHNTYDIEFWGPDGMCTSFYLGALAAAIKMGKALGEENELYAELFEKGVKVTEAELFNGEYFIQKVQWEGLKAKSPLEVQTFQGGYTPEALELLKKEGPKYQYGTGCLSDGVLGAWIAMVCHVGEILDSKKVASHLKAVHRYNLKRSLAEHANPQRPTFAAGSDGGLLLCTWPKGGALSLPFVYSNEVWTGIEYQAASHMMMMGLVEEGLDVVRVARDRYDGRVRNPFNEYECGHWYARAMSSYGLLQGLTGVRYDAVEKVLYVEPSIGGDFRAFLATATGCGTVVVKNGKASLEVKTGIIEVKETRYTPKA
ncbi:MAG: hypothetical protein KA354_09700 [Phycisphaerae bacterium]|nr:hypothetical protein [Phycisphaerae bacterium]